jgi:alpha-galactosidase
MPTPPVIAVVGGGSMIWGRRIVVDLLLNPDLEGAQIRLVDIDSDRLALVGDWCRLVAKRLGVSHTITEHIDLAEGLKDATACLTAISVGGDRVWRYDYLHPQIDGIFQPVGDTTGPGGAIRALRHAPALRKIALTLAEVGAPNAFLLQLTNPLNALTASLDAIPGIRVFGFCHGYYDTEFMFAKSLGLIPGYVHPETNWWDDGPTVRVELAGNNHFCFVDRLQINDRTYEQDDLHTLTPAIFDGPFREAIWSRYGVIVGNFPRHPIEFLPGFMGRKSNFGRMWGVEPVTAASNPLGPERHDDSRILIEEDLAALQRDLSAKLNHPLEHSHEPVAEILASVHTGRCIDVHLNLRNEGAIRGLPDDLHLEMYCRIENGVVHRPSVSLPDAITSEIARIGKNQVRLAQCCQAYDEDLLIEATREDALMMHMSEEEVRRLMLEMVAFERELIFPKA